jgi:exodeoxyribonuclease VII large subunit
MQPTILKLSELNSQIKQTLKRAFPAALWVTAEVASAKCNQSGHCYLELVEKEGDQLLSQVKATIWAYRFREIEGKFRSVTGETLKPGMKILMLAEVSFHELYGLSLGIKDIDPTYTIGDMARKKAEVIERLKREGILEKNKALPLPLVPQRIAIVSSETAAGYQDFIKHLSDNPEGYAFHTVLFQALMQGNEAEASMIEAFARIAEQRHRFDVAVLIRGGGSQIDLSCFDGYEIARTIANFPLPIITGLGHEKDESVADLVAHTRMKTPTACAEFLLSGARAFEEKILEAERTLIKTTERLLKDLHHKLEGATQRLSHSVRQTVTKEHTKAALVEQRLRNGLRNLHKGQRDHIDRLRRDLSARTQNRLVGEKHRLERIDQAIHHLDPARVIMRGYSITLLGGRAVKDIKEVKEGDSLLTRLYNGEITSIATHLEEKE